MRTWFLWTVGLVAGASMLVLLANAQAPASAAAGEKLFREKVAPVLRQHCVQCHNPTKSRGSLDLSTRTTALEGGEQGPALVPGDARKSLLVQMIGGAKPRMPQKSESLAADQVEEIGRWIDAGAPWPID